MIDVIDSIPVEYLKSELTKDRFLRNTNLGNNELYVINVHNSPNVMREIGRLREITFRMAGGGTGLDCDIDEMDISTNPYQQLLVWDPEEEAILGGYRFKVCGKISPKEDLMIATTHLFDFSEEFIRDYLPHSIELGRSFVRPDYQSTAKSRKSLFVLDNLFNGLGAIVVDNPDKKYFFGKVTMYENYNIKARDILLFFLRKHFGGYEYLMKTKNEIQITSPIEEMQSIFPSDDFKENHKILNQQVKKLGENIPPLINSYIQLSSSIKIFGTGINSHFGDVIETGLLITIEDIFPEKAERHIESYKNILSD